MTTPSPASRAILSELDGSTRSLVRLAAVVAAGGETDVRAALAVANAGVSHVWVEELLLQSYLFAGFPRTLNAFREWRRLVPTRPDVDDKASFADWQVRGRETCRRVYGPMYEKLRSNIEALHPELDAWMISEGYGKVLSRPGLDLGRRELCIVAACVASGQERQLHSHLHGALNVGVTPSAVRQALDALGSIVDAGALEMARSLFGRVAGA
jgi:4-carboxymuconolactone decarboxylase